jgi:hypothetical protein
MGLSGVVGIAVLAMLQGTLVALPRADSLRGLAHLRSSLWVAALPCATLVGTLGVLAFPPMAYGLVGLAAVSTPIFALLAMLAVVRARRLSLALAPVAGAVAVTGGSGWIGQAAASLLTALAGLLLGVALVRLIPRHVIPLGVIAMAVVDIALMALGFSEPSWVAIQNATSHFNGPAFDQAAIGPVSLDYPDLVLAAMLGVLLSPRPGVQRRAAAVVTILAAGNGLLALLFAARLPAMIPVLLTLIWLGRDASAQRSDPRLARDGPKLDRLAPHGAGRAIRNDAVVFLRESVAFYPGPAANSPARVRRLRQWLDRPPSSDRCNGGELSVQSGGEPSARLRRAVLSVFGE